MRKCADYVRTMGLFTLEPLSRDRIPLVLIHGLKSRPLTWSRASVEFNADPEINRRYQLYYCRYPTGVPDLVGAAN